MGMQRHSKTGQKALRQPNLYRYHFIRKLSLKLNLKLVHIDPNASAFQEILVHSFFFFNLKMYIACLLSVSPYNGYQHMTNSCPYGLYILVTETTPTSWKWPFKCWSHSFAYHECKRKRPILVNFLGNFIVKLDFLLRTNLLLRTTVNIKKN